MVTILRVLVVILSLGFLVVTILRVPCSHTILRVPCGSQSMTHPNDVLQL